MAERGRPKGDRETVRVTMYLDQELVSGVDKLAEKGGMSRSKLVGHVLRESLTALEKANMVGILDFGFLMRDFGEDLRCWVRSIRDEGHDILADYEDGVMVQTSW
jgi:biotin operon repressor